MVKLDDLRRLAENYQQQVGTPGKAKKKDQLLIEEIYNRYRRHFREAGLENADNVLAKPLPISRESLIWQVWRKELKGKPSVKPKIRSFETTKSTINKNLQEMEAEGLNSKRIRVNTAKAKGFGETANYFIQAKDAATKKEAPQPSKTKPLDSTSESLEPYLKQWEINDYALTATIPREVLVEVEQTLDHNNLSQTCLALLLVSAIHLAHHYRYWGQKNVNNKEAIKHLLHILKQPFRRPYWRAAFVLQYVDQETLVEVMAESGTDLANNKYASKALQYIRNKSVKKYLDECIRESEHLVGPHGPHLQVEFSRPWKIKLSKME